MDYAYPWATVLSEFKFQADPGWSAALGALLRATPDILQAVAAADLLIPVPLSRERLRERGFNQALLLARQLAPRKARPHLLLRLRATDAQSHLPRARRLHNLRGAFALEPARAQQVAGRRVVLVDDVMTTGSTLQAAAQALRQAGAAHVTGVVVARTE